MQFGGHYRQGRCAGRCVVAGLVLVVAACGSSDTPQSSSVHAVAAAPPGVRAYADPDTGDLGVPPLEEGEPAIVAGGGAADVPLAVVPGRTSAGGVMVDLRGRFSYGVRASVSNDGRLSARCDARVDTAGD